MAAITPDSDVILLKVPLEISDTNQLTFANATAQYNYFHGLSGKLVLEDYTYQRKDGVIRCGHLVDNLYGYNYVMYRNNNFSNKWFYAYIEKMEYLNHNTTAIKIRTDVWQTWQFDLEYKRTFVEREHVNNDTIGKHTVPEGLETGEYINANAVTEILENDEDDRYAVIGVTEVNKTTTEGGSLTLTSGTPPTQVYPSTTLNGIPNGLYYLLVPIYDSYSGNATEFVRDVIACYDCAGLADAVQCVFILPKDYFGTALTTNVLLTGSNSQQGLTTTATVSIPTGSNTALKIDTTTFAMDTTPWGSSFTPKNNKLLVYPYNCLAVSNNAGGNVVYKFEDFSTPTSVVFETYAAISPSGSYKLIPKNYKNSNGTSLGTDVDYALTGGKFPMCSWTNDYYINWLTQNAVNLEVKWLGAGAAVAGSFAGVSSAGGIAGAAVGSMMTVFNTIQSMRAENYAAQITPDQARGNINSGDVVCSLDKCCFTAVQRCIKLEYAKIIDDFFSMYGYKVNEVKIPNITGRTNWNYVKTIDCYIKADIPQEDLAEIKDMFNKGITFWHNPATFADYSQSNAIVV